MIELSVLKFGYGDIEVCEGYKSCGLSFHQFTPSLTCGDRVFPQAVTYIGDSIHCHVTSDNYKDLMLLLTQAKKKEISQFEFDGVRFDFSNAEPISAAMCIKHLKISLSHHGLEV